MCTVNGLCHYHTITTFGVLGRSWPAAWGKVGVLGRSFFSLLFCRVKGGAKLAGLGRSSKSRPGWGVFGGVRGRSWPAWGELWKRPLAGQHFSVNWQNIHSVTESVKMKYLVGKNFFCWKLHENQGYESTSINIRYLFQLHRIIPSSFPLDPVTKSRPKRQTTNVEPFVQYANTEMTAPNQEWRFFQRYLYL